LLTHRLQNRDYASNQIEDLANKLEKAEKDIASSGRSMQFLSGSKKKKEERELTKLTKDRSVIFAHVLL